MVITKNHNIYNLSWISQDFSYPVNLLSETILQSSRILLHWLFLIFLDNERMTTLTYSKKKKKNYRSCWILCTYSPCTVSNEQNMLKAIQVDNEVMILQQGSYTISPKEFQYFSSTFEDLFRNFPGPKITNQQQIFIATTCSELC